MLAHGFTQTLASWAPLAGRLRRRWQLVRVDLPGHGGSGALRADLPAAAALLGEAGGPAAYAGYSMGGRVCLRLALDRPDLVRALVLIGASPGIEDAADRAARRAADEALARDLERDGVAAFLDRWLAGPLFATLPAGRAGRAERLGNSAAGLAAAIGPNARVALVSGAGHAAHLERPEETGALVDGFLADAHAGTAW